jgi:predicted acetyltransferase
MITLPEPPHLRAPTTAVRVSYLTGEQADAVQRGTDAAWLGPVSQDFEAHVAERRSITIRWGVPSTILWYVAGEHYLGTLVIRHELTTELAAVGGNIGYHIVGPWQRQGHATRMLGEGLHACRRLGLDRVLLTCDPDNVPSRRVILANGGRPDGNIAGDDRYWITLGERPPAGSRSQPD